MKRILLIVITVLLTVTCRFEHRNRRQRTSFIHELNVGMTLNEIEKNRNTSITECYVPIYEGDTYTIDAFNYYLVDNTTAVILENNQVNQFYTWNRRYRTDDGLSVRSTLGEVLDQYSTSIECWYESSSYNFISMQYESMFYLFDPDTCTGFVFLTSQLTTQQKTSLVNAAYLDDYGSGRVYLSYLSQSVLQSMSSASVSWIMKSDCSRRMFMDSSPGESFFPEKESYPLQRGDFYIKFGDSETFELSDGSKIKASLTTMGLGDLSLKISWSGDTPTKITWYFDGSGMEPTSGIQYSRKSEDVYMIRVNTSFSWLSNEHPTVYGVNFTLHPITEEQRKYSL